MSKSVQKLQKSIDGIIRNSLARRALYLFSLVLVLENTGRVRALTIPGIKAKEAEKNSWWQIKISKRWLMWFLLGDDYRSNATWSERLSSQLTMKCYMTLAVGAALLALAFWYAFSKKDPKDQPIEPRRSVSFASKPSWRIRICQALYWPINQLWNQRRVASTQQFVQQPVASENSSSEEPSPEPPRRGRGRRQQAK